MRVLRASIAILIAMLGILDLHGQESRTSVIDRGLEALQAKQPDVAIAAFKKCLEQSPRYAICAYNLACAYSLKNDAPEAISWLSRAADWGWDDAAAILADEDLANVRAQPGFVAVIETIQNRYPPSRPRPYVVPEDHERGLELVAMLRGDMGSGAAIILGRDSQSLYLATANHVVRQDGADAKTIEVQLKPLAPRWLRARLLPPIADAELDLAIVAVDGIKRTELDFCALPLNLGGDSTRVRRGDPVYPVGYPGGILWAMPLSPDRAAQVFPGQISFESPFVRVGFSGGPLLNRRGEIIGMIVADEPPLGRAVPLDLILKAVRAAGFPVELTGPDERSKQPLHVASKANDVAAVARLLESCADPNLQDASGRAPLHEAAVHGSADAVGLLLARGARRHAWTVIRDTEAEREWGTALHLAAQHGHVEAVNALAENADVDLETLRRFEEEDLRPSDTALHLAARHDRAEAAQALLKLGAAIEARGGDGLTPLGLAARHGSAAVARVLLQHGAAMVAPDQRTLSALQLAAEAGHIEILKLLVENGADVNASETSMYIATPLHAAAAKGQTAAAAYLISKKANVEAPGYDGGTPLQAAAKDGTNAVVELLLASGANVNSSSGSDKSPLALAVQRGDLSIVETLVKAGAETGYLLHDALKREKAGVARALIQGGSDLSLRDSAGSQPLHIAAARRLAESVELLLKAGADVRALDGDGDTPLHHAAAAGSLAVAELLLAAKAPVDALTKAGETPLYKAVDLGHASVVARLLRAGADPNHELDTIASDLTTVLALAASNERVEVLDVLLAAGADPNQKAKAGRPLTIAAGRRAAEKLFPSLLKAGAKVVTDGEDTTAFHQAIGHDGEVATRLLSLLIAAGGPVDARDVNGRTALHDAARQWNIQAAKALLAGGAKIDARDDKCGATPLSALDGFHIDERRSLAMIELLVDAGADVNAGNTCATLTLLELAEKEGHAKIRQFLLSKGAKPR